jgi:DNA-binding NtrC family response regulator
MILQDGTARINLTGSGYRIEFENLHLQVVSGPDAGLEADLCLPVIRIGTAADNDFILTDHTVSRYHVEIRMTPNGWIIRDLGSTNGTYIDSLRITEAYLVLQAKCMLGHTHILIQQQTDEICVSTPDQNRLGVLVGASERMRQLYGLIQAVAPTPATVLITGESGAGKEQVARTLHELSGRSGPLVVLDASVADPEMIRSDLFGHIKGAFTGASGPREGAFRRAQHGTLFIDEIGELPLDLQPRLLRALENREVIPVGSDQPVRVDVRVIAATHRDLGAMVQQGAFRADLFYRLAVLPIRVPPLREIGEDIPLLVQHLLGKLDLKCRVSAEAMAALQRHHWPGNVRELRNVLERAAILCRGGEIQPKDLYLNEEATPRVSLETHVSAPASSPGSLDQLKDLERTIILEALARNQNNKMKTARELGMSLSTLWRKLKAYQEESAED